MFDHCRRFLIASKLQHDGVIDNRSKPGASLDIFLDNVAPRISGAAVCHRPLVTPLSGWLHCEHDEKRYYAPEFPHDCAQRNEQGGQEDDPAAFHFVFQKPAWASSQPLLIQGLPLLQYLYQLDEFPIAYSAITYVSSKL